MTKTTIFLAAIVLSALSVSAEAATSGAHSASSFRPENESYLTTHARQAGSRDADGVLGLDAGRRRRTRQVTTTAWDRQTEFAHLPLSAIPELGSFEVVRQAFAELRDARDWRWDEMPDFARRLPWLYPSDGCYMRAELMTRKLKALGLPAPAHVFAFGDLSYTSQFETATWWYHVAPVYRVGGRAWVIDPAIDFRTPLRLEAWASLIYGKQPPDSGFRAALCAPGAVAPEDDCDAVDSTWSDDGVRDTLQTYLATEWSSLEEALGRSPVDLLGDHPPWQ